VVGRLQRQCERLARLRSEVVTHELVEFGLSSREACGASALALRGREEGCAEILGTLKARPARGALAMVVATEAMIYEHLQCNDNALRGNDFIQTARHR
jgi:hypothetical protein